MSITGIVFERLKKMTKQEIRVKFLANRAALARLEKVKFDELICQKVIKIKEFIESNHIAFYAADEFEVNLNSIFERFCCEKNFYLPRYNPASKVYEMVKIIDLQTDLVVGKYGLLEPKESLVAADDSELESMLFLVPGVAFDSSCQRLGRGKGFYDRLLQKKKFSVGVFFECQKTAEIPVETHDLALDMIVTEKEIYRNAK